ncbi:hypothetical protein LZ017_00675 [Pelomonas sp. CA6]|uniref:hypothetical protein n=1 Tax=Pelomonas sp. CA6 TaxID=2907999 RepID=UPI001F4A2642|nr:hypothetical protein [Pelomonas sp. CA6]MCH7341900.1 hypothetical protein [Pelomonas sp. CA6]
MKVDLVPQGLLLDGSLLRNALLPRLLAALLQAHAQGGARPQAACSRAELRERIVGLPELHRTQLWRALNLLQSSALAGLVCSRTLSSGPFWLDEARLAQCRFLLQGQDLTPARRDRALAAWLGQHEPPGGEPDAAPPLPLAYVDGLARADHLLERGELYPARLALRHAAEHLPARDDSAAAALALRRARIARRLGDWAALQDELRALRQGVERGRLPEGERAQLRLRSLVLEAWHRYGSLGQPAAALRHLDTAGPPLLAQDPALRGEVANLRGLALRELALARRDAALAEQSLQALEQALRCASLAGLPDALQIAAANLANSLAQLLEAGLLAGSARAPDLAQALRWLLLSDAVCARWQLGRHSLLNTVFLLRLAEANALPFARVAAAAAAQGQPLQAEGYAALAAQRWAQCRAVHSQIPVEQRCAFFLMWARHAQRDGDPLSAADLARQVALQARKLRDAATRERYRQELQRLRLLPQRA